MAEELGENCFLVLAGNIGSGKTTLAKKLSERLGLSPHYEPVADNPYLSDFYQDMKRWSFPLQIYFLTHRYHSHKEIILRASEISSVQDRSIYEDAHIFARALFEQGDMSERDYETYIRLFQIMMDQLAPPTLIVYLKRSVPKLAERIHLRGRGYENSIPVDYLTRLNCYYQDWINKVTHSQTLTIDTDPLDLLNSEEDFQFLLSQIRESLRSSLNTTQLFC